MVAENSNGPLPPLMKYRDVAAYLGIDRRTLVQYVAEGIIPSVRVGKGSRRFVRAEIERWVREGKQGGEQAQ